MALGTTVVSDYSSYDLCKWQITPCALLDCLRNVDVSQLCATIEILVPRRLANSSSRLRWAMGALPIGSRIFVEAFGGVC